MEWHAIIKAIFNGLAEEGPPFIGFANTHLYENVSAICFSPGLTAAMAGEGVSVLSFTPMDITKSKQQRKKPKYTMKPMS
jgi:hypothetical protein